MSLPTPQSTMKAPTQPRLAFLTAGTATIVLAAFTGYLVSLALHERASWAWPIAGVIASALSGALALRYLKWQTRQLHDAQVVGVTGPLSQALEPGAAPAKQASAAKALQGMRMLEAAFEQSGAAMVISDALDRIVLVNPAFVEFSGHPATTVLGQPAELMGMAPLRGTHLPELEQALDEGQRWGGESTLTTAQGSVQDVWLNVSTIRNEQQRITHHCRVFQDVNPLKEQLRAMADQARHDSLTGLPNRRAFGEQLFRAMARSRRYAKALAILCVDLDGFKGVNDRHGHPVGDELLVQVARRLLACVRTTDVVCRMGGDEFTLILEGAGAVQDVQRMGQRVLTCLSEAYAIDGHHITVTPSIGAVMHDGKEPDTVLLERADAAMYAAKHSGKGRLVMGTLAQGTSDQASAAA